MLIVDANLLIYAYNADSAQHERARAWLEGVLNGDEPVGLPLTTVLAFVRITTDPNLLRRPQDLQHALGIVRDWLQRPGVTIAEPTPEHWPTLLSVATEGQARGPMLMDAHLAALAIEHGATLCTADRDFRRFKGVRVVDPLGDRPA